jgi:hypothetical protein
LNSIKVELDHNDIKGTVKHPEYIQPNKTVFLNRFNVKLFLIIYLKFIFKKKLKVVIVILL